MLSRAIEDYLKVIYQIAEDGQTVTTSALADALGISNASATNMIKKLARLKLARHSPYHGVELTDAGAKIALEVVRHHRLIETFLAQALGMPLDRVHAEAHNLEHVISEDLEERIANYLGNPTLDPHGDPIPNKSLEIDQTRHMTLADIPVGQSAVIQRLSDQDPERLRHFSSRGLTPNSTLTVLEREPLAGPIRVRTQSGVESVLDDKTARTILVTGINHKARPEPFVSQGKLREGDTKSTKKKRQIRNLKSKI